MRVRGEVIIYWVHSVMRITIFQTFVADEKLQSFFSILSTNVAANGVDFVSTMEGSSTFISILKWWFINKGIDNSVTIHQVRNTPSTGCSGTLRWTVFSGKGGWTSLTPATPFSYRPCWLSFSSTKVIDIGTKQRSSVNSPSHSCLGFRKEESPSLWGSWGRGLLAYL